jgi:PAS domain S-box-containing protein
VICLVGVTMIPQGEGLNSTSFDKLLRQVVVVPVCALLLTAAILVWQLLSFSHTVTSIERSDRLIANTIQIAGLVVDQETRLRGYQLTRDPVFLGPFNRSNQALRGRFEQLSAAEEIPEERNKVELLKNGYNAWLTTFALPLIEKVQTGGTTLGPALNLQGKGRMDTIRSEISDLTQAAEISRDQRVKLWRSQVRSLSIGLILLALLVGLMIGLYVRRLLHKVSFAYRQSHRALSVRAEQTFRSEEKLRTTVESIADGVITCDPLGRVQTMNTMARELTGWSLEDAHNRPLSDVFSIINESDRQPADSPLATVQEGDRLAGRSHQIILVRRNGKELFIEHSGAPIRDKLGKLAGVVIVFQDVTLAKKSRDALLANEKLAVAGRLAAAIAHEIHNPLDAVANLLYMMATNEHSAENIQFLELAQQEITRVTQISRAMLSLYRESKTPVPINLKEMFESILFLMDMRFRTLGVSVTSDLPKRLVIQGFPAELRQVFTNLLTNAAEASGRGSTVEIIARRATTSKPLGVVVAPPGVVIQIVDHGPGIPLELRDQLFKPFFTTKGEAGTGLGLWISKGIVNKHGGTLNLASQDPATGHGTTATVFLAYEPAFGGLNS